MRSTHPAKVRQRRVRDATVDAIPGAERTEDADAVAGGATSFHAPQGPRSRGGARAGQRARRSGVRPPRGCQPGGRAVRLPLRHRSRGCRHQLGLHVGAGNRCDGRGHRRRPAGARGSGCRRGADDAGGAHRPGHADGGTPAPGPRRTVRPQRNAHRFINAVAVNIVLAQLADFTGYDATGENRITRTLDTMLHVASFHWLTVAAGTATILLILGLERTRLRGLGMVLAVILVSGAVALLGSPGGSPSSTTSRSSRIGCRDRSCPRSRWSGGS